MLISLHKPATTTPEVRSAIQASDQPEEFVQEIPTSTARLGPLLSAQSDEQRATIEQAIRERAVKYASDGEIRIPCAVVLASGQNP